MGKKLVCQTEGVSATDLNLNSFGTPLTVTLLASCIYSSRLILCYSNHLGNRQTVENYLIHTSHLLILSCACNTMMSSLSTVVHFLFLQRQISPQKLYIFLHPLQFSAIRWQVYVGTGSIYSSTGHTHLCELALATQLGSELVSLPVKYLCLALLVRAK